MKPIFKFTLIAITFSLLFGCEKSEISGCTNPSAANYSKEAESDLGNCLYGADMKFWVQESTWSAFQSAGVNSLTVFISNKAVGTLPSSATYLAAPLCANSDLLEYTHLLNSPEASTSASITYTVKDQNNSTVSSGTISLTNSDCHIEEIQ